jgi:hypothetical protein
MFMWSSRPEPCFYKQNVFTCDTGAGRGGRGDPNGGGDDAVLAKTHARTASFVSFKRFNRIACSQITKLDVTIVTSFLQN